MFAVIYGVYAEMLGGWPGKHNFESVKFFAKREDAMAFIGEYEGTPSPYPPTRRVRSGGSASSSNCSMGTSTGTDGSAIRREVRLIRFTRLTSLTRKDS